MRPDQRASLGRASGMRTSVRRIVRRPTGVDDRRARPAVRKIGCGARLGGGRPRPAALPRIATRRLARLPPERAYVVLMNNLNPRERRAASALLYLAPVAVSLVIVALVRDMWPPFRQIAVMFFLGWMLAFLLAPIV